MFKCTCGYHTCKKKYSTEFARNRHMAGVLAQKTKQLLAQSAVEKPNTTKKISKDIRKNGLKHKSNNNTSQKVYLSGKLATEATKLKILEIDRKNGRPSSQFVEFRGKSDGESNGIIDLLSIKKNRDKKMNSKLGLQTVDLLDIIHIQVKGGNSNFPSSDEIERMSIVSKFYHCKATLLSTWNPEKFNDSPKFHSLTSDNKWNEVNLEDILN